MRPRVTFYFATPKEPRPKSLHRPLVSAIGSARVSMTAAEFKTKWSRYQGKESAAYQEHFIDLCRLLGQPTPVEADPSGNDCFCFQKRVVKGAEFLNLEHPDRGDPTEHGFADVWKKDCFGWEYKGKKKSLDIACEQLQQYREALLNPPLLIVCDFDRYIIKTNFNGTVQEIHEFTHDHIDRRRTGAFSLPPSRIPSSSNPSAPLPRSPRSLRRSSPR